MVRKGEIKWTKVLILHQVIILFVKITFNLLWKSIQCWGMEVVPPSTAASHSYGPSTMLVSWGRTAMMIGKNIPSTMLDHRGFKVSRKISVVAKAPLRCWTSGDGLQSLTWAAGGRAKHTHWQIVSKFEVGMRRCAPEDLTEEGGICAPPKSLLMDCKRLGGCGNSIVDLGRAQVWSVERPPLVPRGRKFGSTAKVAGP